MQIVAIIFCVYILVACANWLVCEWTKQSFEDKPIRFTILYFILSPFTLFGSINRAFDYWAEDIENGQSIVQKLREEIEDTKYASLSDTDLLDLSATIANFLIDGNYFECTGKDWTVLSVMERLEEEGFIVKDENGYHATDLTK